MTYVLKVRDFDGDGKNLSFQLHRAGCEHTQHADIAATVLLPAPADGRLPGNAVVRRAFRSMGYTASPSETSYMDCAIFGTPT